MQIPPMKRNLLGSAIVFMVMKFSESRSSYNSNIEYMTTRIIPFLPHIIMCMKGCMAASKQPAEIANERVESLYIEDNYCQTSISFYVSYFILYFCDDSAKEKERRDLVKECLISKIDASGIAQPRKEEIIQRFENIWNASSVDNHESDFYLAMDYVLIKIALEAEKYIVNGILSIKSMSAALLTHYFFKDIMTLKLMLAEKMIEMAQSEHLCPCIRDPNFFESTALRYTDYMSFEKMCERYLTSIPSVDVNVLMLFYDIEGEFLHEALINMRSEIKENIYQELAEKDVMVECFADLFLSDINFTTTELNPGSTFPNEKLKVITKDAGSEIYNFVSPIILEMIGNITGTQGFKNIVSRAVTSIQKEMASKEYKENLSQHLNDYQAALKELEKTLEDTAVEKMTQAFSKANPSKDEISVEKKTEDEGQATGEELVGAVGGHE
ncbi:hypothetical protein LUQ84_001277 [Hamiltosporidium tvaerminnensis]|nr:hypothetical protein LUQ84_001277 [Hamiltosporidium tvaerminnensis]